MPSIRSHRSVRSLTAAAGLFIAVAAQAAAAPDLRSLAAPVRSFSGTMTVQQANMDELVKIRKDYAQSYRVKSSRISYQYPDRLKVDGNVGPMSVIYIINGNTKLIKYGPIRREKNLVNDPGQKQGLLDFGILTADQLEDYTWKFLRTDSVNGKPFHVYELRFKNFREDPSRRLIWVDPARKVVVRRQTFHQKRDNDLKMDMRFEGVQQVAPGIWSPTIIKVYNDQGKLGASSRLSNIVVNKPIPLSAFKL
ncbi:MAG: outer membrane lipoprotein-sorting protein [Armatimonadetes bacterium]|nr:outer membrane lipoprotein-sorting protein [Armatimonadota bacterium]